MGDVMGLKQPKEKIYSAGMNAHQLQRVIKDSVLSDAAKQMLAEAIESFVLSAATLITVLPDAIELDCGMKDVDNVVIVKDEEEAQEAMDRAMGAEGPVPGDKIH